MYHGNALVRDFQGIETTRESIEKVKMSKDMIKRTGMPTTVYISDTEVKITIFGGQEPLHQHQVFTSSDQQKHIDHVFSSDWEHLLHCLRHGQHVHVWLHHLRYWQSAGGDILGLIDWLTDELIFSDFLMSSLPRARIRLLRSWRLSVRGTKRGWSSHRGRRSWEARQGRRGRKKARASRRVVGMHQIRRFVNQHWCIRINLRL